MAYNMKWYNPPPDWTDSGDEIRVTSGPDSDFWRTTHYGFIRDSGHFYYRTIAGDMRAEVRVQAAYRDQYDQAGLMIRLDAQHWIKCGIELVDGVQQISSVVTRDYSDWSVRPLEHAPGELHLQATRHGDAIEIQYALDGGPLTLLRLAYLPPGPPAQVGIMCASPDGTGFESIFRGLRIEPL